MKVKQFSVVENDEGRGVALSRLLRESLCEEETLQLRPEKTQLCSEPEEHSRRRRARAKALG